MGGAHGFAFAAAQTILDAVGNRTDIALLHDERLMPHQSERGRVGIAQIRMKIRWIEQLAFVESTLGIDALLVIAKFTDFGIGEKFQFGDADAVLAGDHAIERTRQCHDALDCRMGGLQHRVIIGIDRDIGVHIAITGVHVQRDEHTTTQHALVNGTAFIKYEAECGTTKDLTQRSAQL